MTDDPPRTTTFRLLLTSPAQTTALAETIAPLLRAGDAILVEGPIGAGKSHFCRGVIQARLAEFGAMEDIPSPTFTLVQTYALDDVEIWHSDLYRLNTPDETAELGLDQAFDTAISLVEWPDRLGRSAPASALTLRLTPGGPEDARHVELITTNPRWFPVLERLGRHFGSAHE